MAQQVLVQLFKTTTELPMVEFSDALETLGTLTDAFKMKQKVQLSIKRDGRKIYKIESQDLGVASWGKFLYSILYYIKLKKNRFRVWSLFGVTKQRFMTQSTLCCVLNLIAIIDIPRCL